MVLEQGISEEKISLAQGFCREIEEKQRAKISFYRHKFFIFSGYSTRVCCMDFVQPYRRTRIFFSYEKKRKKTKKKKFLKIFPYNRTDKNKKKCEFYFWEEKKISA
jgi:hypothetical protein